MTKGLCIPRTLGVTQNLKIPSSHTIQTKVHILHSWAKCGILNPGYLATGQCATKGDTAICIPFSEPLHAPGDISALPSLRNSKLYIILARDRGFFTSVYCGPLFSKAPPRRRYLRTAIEKSDLFPSSQRSTLHWVNLNIELI